MTIILRIVGRSFSRIKRHLMALFSSLDTAAAEPLLRRRPKIAPLDILGVGADGSVNVGISSGPAPAPPRKVSDADFSSERAQRLARRAAIFLFDHYDFVAVPGQFWPFLGRSFDPGDAMEAFLRAIGCDSDRVRQRDLDELRRAGEVIELLVLSGDILHRLPAEMRRIIGLELETGNYDYVRRTALTATRLSAALAYAEPWTGKRILPGFTEFLRKIEEMLSRAGTVEPDDAEQAVRLVAQFSDAQSRFDGLNGRFSTLVEELGGIWPLSWNGSEHERDMRKNIYAFEDTVANMLSRTDLFAPDEIAKHNETLAEHLENLDRLLKAAREEARRAHASGTSDGKSGGKSDWRAHAGGTSGGKTDGRSGRKPDDKPKEKPDPVEVALAYFGFSKKNPPKSKSALRSVWAVKVKCHPDRHFHLRETPDEIKARNEEFHRCNDYHNILRDFYGW